MESVTEGAIAPEVEIPTPSEVSGTTEAPATPEMLELDKHERFKYAGQEWSLKDLQASIMRQADYTRKTQGLAKERDFIANLKADLNHLRRDPSLVGKFKEVYSDPSYQELADSILESLPQTQGQSAKSNIDPAIDKRFKSLEGFVNTERTKAIEAEMKATFQELTPKYPYALEDSVLALADTVIEKAKSGGIDEKYIDPETGRISTKGWEEIFKSVHERVKKFATEQNKKMMESQKQANAKARDMAPGGGIPGQAPKKMTLREAGRHAVELARQGKL